ncbi:relaxin-3-like protein [Lates japonicus]|uniref:Relaxin-3-like protein n=1 Tax=Lates japonicus TaxID=270547 RepID=A0AAD3MCS4_LATJO|nr:relaxin-3-like protein [Lates japonicus]
MRSLLLLAMLLCVLCVAQVQTQDNTNTLRLCGRAFVRAVVYTCGGSRWRRLMGEEDTLPRGQYTDL